MMSFCKAISGPMAGLLAALALLLAPAAFAAGEEMSDQGRPKARVRARNMCWR